MEERYTFEELLKQNGELQTRIRELEKNLKIYLTNEDSRNRFTNIFRATPHIMALSDLETGKYIDVNENFLVELGYSREEIIDRRSQDINLFADLVQSDKFISKLAKMKKVENFPVSLKTSSGEIRNYLFSADTVSFNEEKYLLTVYTAKVSDELSEEEILAACHRTRELFESLSNFIMAVRPDGNGSQIVECINPDSREFRSTPASEIIMKELRSLPITNRDVLYELVSSIILTGEPQKVNLSAPGKENEGYYFGIRLQSGEIVIIWEPGAIQRSREKELLMQGDIFERFADMIPEVVFEINTRGKITYANLKGLEKFGYTKEDLESGLSIREVFGEDQLPKVFKNLSQLRGPGTSVHNEYYVKMRDGTAMTVLSHTYGIYDEHQKLIGYRGILTDLTESKKFQDDILREKSYFETLFEFAPESIVQTSLDGIIMRVNKEFTKEFGYTREEAVGKNVDLLIVPEELRDEAKSYTYKASFNETIATETERLRKNGEKLFVSLLIKPIQFNEETTGLYAIYRNISQKRKDMQTKEVILNISNAALTQTEFTDIYATINQEIGKIWNTKNFYIVLYNRDNHTLTLPFFTDEKDSFSEIPAQRTLTGWLIKKAAPVVLRLKDIDILEEQGEVDLVGTPCKVWLGVPLVVEEEIIGAMVLQDYDNENAFSEEDLRLLSLIGNQIALALQRKRMMNNLILERRKAEEAAKLKQQFMSTMSHEIRTPLNEVIGITNLLLQGNPRNDQMEFIKTLRFSGNHLLTLVNDVLDFTKIESGMIVFEKTQFSLIEFANDLKRSYSYRSDQKGLEFRSSIDERLPSEIIGDSIRLNQVLSNLLSNAFKFTSSGFIEMQIRLIEKKNRMAEIEFAVEDTGIGIAKDKQQAIFESYTQASDDTTRKYGGTGLGLSICKRLIEMQGGSINVVSAPGKGSRFYFNLKFSIGDQTTVKSPEESEAEDTYEGLVNKKILIAEDNKINFFVANKFLTKWGIKVTHAENGEIALDLIRDNDFDLVLMDLHMPVMDGIEATEKIRASDDPRIKNIPVVALTAAIMSEHQDKIEGLSINDYILKPFKPRELYTKILSHIR